MNSKKSILIFTILFTFSFFVKAQDNKVIDSLLNIIENSNSDSLKIKTYSYLALKLEETHPDRSIEYAQVALKIALDNNNEKGIAQAHNLLGRTYSYTYRYELAETHLLTSLELFIKLDDKMKIAEIYNNLGILFYYQNKFPESIAYLRSSANYYIALSDTLGSINTYNNIGLIIYYTGNNVDALKTYDTALILAEQIHDDHSIINLLVNRGIVYDRMGNRTQAINDYYNSLEICERTGNTSGKSSCLNNIADCYLSSEEFDKALEFYNRSLELDRKSNDRLGEVISLNNIGDVFLRQKKYDLAFKTLKKADSISKDIGDERGQARALHIMGRIFFAQNKTEKAIQYYQQALKIRESLGLKNEMAECLFDLADLYNSDSKYIMATISLQKAIEYKINIDSREDLNDYYYLLSEIYANRNQYKNAYLYHLKYKSLSDSLYSTETAHEITKIQMDYEYKKEKEIIDIKHQKKNELYEHEIRSQKTLRNFLIGGLFVVLILLSQIYRLFRTKSKIVKELQAKNKIINSQKHEIEKIVEELEVANDTKDKFFSIIAHDLKGPFNVIIGFSDLLRNHHQEYDEDAQREFIINVNEAAKRTFELVVNLLEWARSQTGSMEFNPQKIHLNEIINKSIGLLKLQAKNKNIGLSYDGSNMDLHVYGDSYMISTVLRNLISNAIKFTQMGNVFISVEKMDDYCQIIIKDSGVGISDEQVKDLFKIDKSSSSKGTAGETGTGLGLLLCKDFVEKNGGQISVESKIGIGSRFMFTLPLK